MSYKPDEVIAGQLWKDRLGYYILIVDVNTETYKYKVSKNLDKLAVFELGMRYKGVKNNLLLNEFIAHDFNVYYENHKILERMTSDE